MYFIKKRRIAWAEHEYAYYYQVSLSLSILDCQNVCTIMEEAITN